MAQKFVVAFEGVEKSPFRSLSKGPSMRQFINFLVAAFAGSLQNKGVKAYARNNAVAASGTVTFSGPATAADTVTLNGTALTAQVEYANGVVTFASLANADTVTVGAITYTAKTSPTNPTDFALGASDTAAATNFAAKVNANATSNLLVTAYSAAAVVTVRSKTRGTAGNHGGANAVALSSSNGTRAAVTGTSSGDLNGASAAANNKFDVGGDATSAGDAFAAAVGASTTSIVSSALSAVNAAGVVTVSARLPGVMGNMATLAKSGSNIAVSAAKLTGGAEDAPFKIVFT